MKSTNTQDESASYGEMVRAQYDTEGLPAIMGRFFDAVRWRSE